MGVPVVTLVGKRHGERYDVLDPREPRRDATVARTESEYVEIACRLATESGFMSTCAFVDPSRLAASPLADVRATHVRSSGRISRRWPQSARRAAGNEQSGKTREERRSIGG